MVKQNALHNEFPQILLPLKHSKIQAVCFQNGYGHLELLQELLPQAAVWAAVTTEAAKRKTLTEVIHAGRGEICIGKVGGSNTTHGPSALISFIETLTAAGFSASMSKEVDTMIYRKLLINAVINPLTAIWRVPNGELLASEQRIHLMKELYEEAIAVYEACGIALESNAWEGIMEVCRATAGNISSMLADVLSSRATEIRWINGSIVDMAEREWHRCSTTPLDLPDGRRHACEGEVRLFGISAEFVHYYKRYSDCSFFNRLFCGNRPQKRKEKHFFAGNGRDYIIFISFRIGLV